jgi:Domain of unknown function (DUF4114)
MEETNVVPTTVDLLTSTEPKVVEVAPAPVVSSVVEASPIVNLVTTDEPKVVEVTPVPVVTVAANPETAALETSVVETGILEPDGSGLLGITDPSLVAENAVPSVVETAPDLVTAPVLAALPTVLDVLQLDGAIGSKFQNLAQGHTIDLSDYTGIALKVDVTTQGEAAYTNNIGFYIVEDAIGTIKLADGTSLKPGDANYAVEAVKNALTNSLQAGKIDSKLDQAITGGLIYAPVVVAQGSLTDFVNQNPSNGGGAKDIHAYVNYVLGNSDNVDHFKLLGNNTFGVEDMHGGGDRDFNDLVISMNIKTA